MRRHLGRILVLGLVLSLVMGVAATVAANGNGRSYSADLSGDGEVPAVATDATGRATFQAAKNGTVLNFQVVVKDLDDATQAHIHLGAPDANGNIVAFLFGFANPAVSGNGRLATGTLTDADLINDLNGQTIADLITQIEAGNAYVNVHTVVHPGGEIRGQIS